MTTGEIVEVAIALAMFAGGIVLYRRRAGDRRGSQAAVLLFLVAAIVLMHALGLFEYRPSASELAAQ